MKSIIIFAFIILACFNNVFAQENITYATANFSKNLNTGFLHSNEYINSKYLGYDTGKGLQKDYDFYKRKSKNQRTVGWATLGGGILLSGLGILLATNDYDLYSSNANYPGILIVAGCVSGIVSIPFMILANINKHKAKLILETQKTGFSLPPGISKSVVGISFQIKLGS